MTEATILLLTCPHPGWGGVQQSLRAARRVRIVGVTQQPQTAIDAAAREQPAMVLTSLAAAEALAVLRQLQQSSPQSALVVVADRLAEDEYAALLDLDVQAVVAWASLSATGLACCLDAVLAGGLRLRSDAFQAAALRALRRVDQPRRARPSLSAQEAGLLECSACGLTQAQTARSLHLGERTAKRAFSALMERLDAANSRQLMRAALLMGFGTANAAAA